VNTIRFWKIEWWLLGVCALSICSYPSFAQRVWNNGYYDDAAPQFNEQGYLKANSFTNAGKASVNNFNGNLVYRKPLYSIKGPGGFDLNIALSYNGSTPHSIVNQMVDQYSQLRSPVSINTPEWVLSVNGIGIQVLNFENNLFNWAAGPAGTTTARYDSVALLVDGYHLTSLEGRGDVHSSLNYLHEDGTTELIYDDTLVPYDSGCGKADGKTSFTKLWSRCHRSGGQEAYQEYWIKRGDGTTLHGKTYHPVWKSGYPGVCDPGHFNYYSLEPGDTLGMFLADSLYDNDGHVITFEYMDTFGSGNPPQHIYGHPLLTKVVLDHDTNLAISIDYGFASDSITSINVGEYTLNLRSCPGTPKYPSLFGEANRAYITSIVDPAGRKTEFEYGRYVRGITNLPIGAGKHWIGQPCHYDSVTAENVYPDLYRISKILENTGGVTEIGYYKQGVHDSLSKGYSESAWWKLSPNMRYELYWDSTGRDGFFNNFVTSLTRFNVHLVEELVSKDSFVYSWHNHADLRSYDQTDTLFTDRYSDSTLSPVTAGSHTRYTYVMYPFSRYFSSAEGQYWAPDWFIALIREANQYDTVSYAYDVGSCDSKPPDYPGCDGTFRLISKEVSKSGMTFRNRFGFKMATDGFNFEADTVVSSSGVKTATARNCSYINVNGPNSLYFTNLTGSTKSFGISGALLTETSRKYYSDSSADGNRGSLKEVTNYLIADGARADSSTVKFYYHQNATEGVGNLKKLVSPNGDSLRFWYSLDDSTLGNDTYNLSYYLVSKGGSSTHCREKVPVYRAKFTRLNQYSSNGALQQYRALDRFGEITRLIDFNGTASIYDYDNIWRARRYLLPASVDSVLPNSNGVITRASVYGFDADYDYVDTLFGSMFTHTTITRKLKTDTLVIVPETTFVVQSVYKSARRSYQGSDTETDTVRVDQFVPFSLILPTSQCEGNARIRKNGITVDEIYCGNANVSDSFLAFKNDIITAEVNDDSPHGSNYEAGFTLQVPSIQTISIDTLHDLTRKTRSFVDGFSRLVKSRIYDPDHTYDSLMYRFDYRDLKADSLDQYGNVTKKAFDRVGRQVRTIYPDSSQSKDSMVYGSMWRQQLPTAVTSHNNMVDSFLSYTTRINENGDSATEYVDAQNHIRFVKQAVGSEIWWTVLCYDELGHVIKIVRPKGDSTLYTYNSFGQLTMEYSHDYDSIVYRYDMSGNLARKQDGRQRARSTASIQFLTYYKYDGLDRMIECGEVKIHNDDSLTPTRRFFRDQTQSSYSLGQLSLSFASFGNFRYGERYDYDSKGRLSKQVNYFHAILDSTFSAGRYNYSLRGDSLSVAYTYNLGDLVTSIAYPNGLMVNYGYDQRGRLRSVGDGTDAEKYALSSYTHRDELSQRVLGRGLQTVDYSYNARKWLNAINDPTSLGSDKFAERLYYYGNGSDTSSRYFNGNIGGQVLRVAGQPADFFKFLYDDANRLATVQYKDGSPYFAKEKFSYDANGNRISYTYQPILLGDTTGYQYIYKPGLNRLDSISTMGVISDRLSYDANGNLSAQQSKAPYFQYDTENQLDTVAWSGNQTPQNILSFGYSPIGERVYKKYDYYWRERCGDPGPIDPPVDLMQGNGQGDSSGTESFMNSDSTSDTLGSILGEGRAQTNSSGGGGGEQYCTRHDSTRTFYFVSQGKILAEYQNLSSGPKFAFVYAGDQKIAIYDGQNRIHYYLSDHLGSTRVVIDTAGTVEDSYRYLAFGAPDLGQYVNSGQHNRYTGKPYDDDHDLNLYYFGARYYDASIGRFTQIDPLRAKSPTWSPYIYGADDPYSMKDIGGLVAVQSEFGSSEEAGKRVSEEIDNPIDRFSNKNEMRYVGLANGNFVDLKHFTEAFRNTNALIASGKSNAEATVIVMTLGQGVELWQMAKGLVGGDATASAFSPEDQLSNALGIEFAKSYDPEKPLATQISSFLNKIGALSLDDFKTNFPDMWKALPEDEKSAAGKKVAEHVRDQIRSHWNKEKWEEFWGKYDPAKR
jgi:RHS repeat-associated protein